MPSVSTLWLLPISQRRFFSLAQQSNRAKEVRLWAANLGKGVITLLNHLLKASSLRKGSNYTSSSVPLHLPEQWSNSKELLPQEKVYFSLSAAVVKRKSPDFSPVAAAWGRDFICTWREGENVWWKPCVIFCFLVLVCEVTRVQILRALRWQIHLHQILSWYKLAKHNVATTFTAFVLTYSGSLMSFCFLVTTSWKS